MLSIEEINLLQSHNAALKKQNEDFQKEYRNLSNQLKDLKAKLKSERVRNTNLMKRNYELNKYFGTKGNVLPFEIKKLKQECDYLKRRVKGEIHLGKCYKKDFAEQVTETNRYLKALEEIEGMLQVIVESNKVYPLQSNLYKILDIISKAKGEEHAR